ncbi:hypothetical protein [Brevundimonas sp.]
MPLHFLHIGKTGGSAFVSAIRSVGADDEIRLHAHDVTMADVPVGEKAIFFLRRPVDRFVSGFYSRFRQGRPLTFRPWKPTEVEAFTRFPTASELAEGLCADDEDTREAARAAMQGIGHVRSSFYDWIIDQAYLEARWPDIAFIGFQETLNADFEWLKAQGMVPAEARLPTDDVTAHRTPSHFDQTLTPRGRAAIEQWYARDIAFARQCAVLRRARWPDAPPPPALE